MVRSEASAIWLYGETISCIQALPKVVPDPSDIEEGRRVQRHKHSMSFRISRHSRLMFLVSLSNPRAALSSELRISLIGRRSGKVAFGPPPPDVGQLKLVDFL
jgi:hypothetical protein